MDSCKVIFGQIFWLLKNNNNCENEIKLCRLEEMKKVAIDTGKESIIERRLEIIN